METSEIPASDKTETEKMVKFIKEQFSEIFLATTYATKEDRKYALLRIIELGKKYTIKELQQLYMDEHSVPISRVAINNYVNELEAEEKIMFTREGRGGPKIVSLKE